MGSTILAGIIRPFDSLTPGWAGIITPFLLNTLFFLIA
jgi:hypothetical protein